MSEVEKMYENAEVKKQIPKICSSNELYCKECKAHIEDAMPYCKNAEYPPFTAEKQLELIKWLAKNEMLCRLESEYPYFERFEECIAYIIDYLWQDLTEEERKQIKNILESEVRE